MSRMAELDLEIRELLNDGLGYEEISLRLDIPIQWVYAVVESEMPDYDDSMDGDFDSAMASAGFGTDEDYGYYGD